MTDGSSDHKKRDYVILLGVGFIIVMIFVIRGEFTNIAQNQIQTINDTLANTTKAVKLNAENQKIAFSNQKVIAKGLNQLGNVLIGDVHEIKNSTDLIADIKFDTEAILNQTVKEIKIGNDTIPTLVLLNETR